jgi:membrane protease YdiL (CAAX protease family)
MTTLAPALGIEPLLRLLGPLVLAVAAALAFDRLTEARGLTPPGLRIAWRRAVSFLLLTVVFYVGVFLSLGMIGVSQVSDFDDVPISQLFSLHAVFVLVVLVWLLLAFGGVVPARDQAAVAARQVGLRARSVGRELVIGLGAGLLTWPILLAGIAVAAIALRLVGLEQALPQQPPAMVLWLIGLPLWTKVAIAVSAGFVEELFFRGFLQPRMGIPLSTLFFVIAHLAYDQPFMLVGIALLSLWFALLVKWRQNVWAAAVAHFLFDLVQLLVIIPWAVERWALEAPELAHAAGLY